MAKNTLSDISSLGLRKELFKIEEDGEFETYLSGVIAEQAAILEGRVGPAIYASEISPSKDFVKRAEKCLIAAELIQRRINLILSNIVGSGSEINVTHEGAQKKVYADEADYWISKIISGATSDAGGLASGVLITSHFYA